MTITEAIPETLDLPSPVEKELLKYFNRSSPLTIFDIGSCDGQDAIRYSRIFSKAKIFSFEPLPDNVRKIEFNISHAAADAGISVHEVAMSDTVGTAKMQISSGSPSPEKNYTSQSSSLLPPDKHLVLFPWCKFEEELEVRTDTIRNFCSVQHITKIDFIHLDVQGAELMVLRGAEDYMSAINCIWLEVENVSLYKNQPLRKDIEEFMQSNDFILVKFRVGGFSGDQFYIRRAFLTTTPNRSPMVWYDLRSAWMRNPLVIMVSRVIRKFKFLLG